MKTYAAAFQSALSAPTSFLCTCWLITLASGQKIGFTDFDRPIAIDDVTYQPAGGFKPSDVDRGLEFQANQVTLQSFFSAQLPESLFASGQLRDARVFVFRVDPANLPDSLSDRPLAYDPLIRGRLGALTLTDQTYEAAVQGLQAALESRQGWVVSPTCRNRFCDGLCGLDIEDWTDSVTVIDVVNPQLIAIDRSFREGYYTGSRLIWQTGNNIGLEATITYSSASQVRLLVAPPNAIAIGDTLQVERASDKSFASCVSSFGNGARFNGEPGLPGAIVGSDVRGGEDAYTA